jgi:cytochrome c biogenesis protein CcmG, thiol:disulfide interchange protein DsbE
MPLNIGDPAPNLTLKDVLTGQTHSLSDYADQTVLLIFSGPSWCGPCKFEAPVLEELWQVFGVGFSKTQFLMVSVGETEQSYKTAVQNFGLTFPCLYDPNNTDPNNSLWTKYLVEGVPTVYVINGEQKVCNFHVGVISPADALYTELSNMLINCGASFKQQVPVVDTSRWAAVVTVLFGVIQDGGGVVFPPGGRPIHIGPWGPLLRMSPEKKNVLMNLAISEMTKSVGDARTAGEIERAALRSAEASMKKLVAQASQKPLELSATHSAVKKT